jgi:sugar phosphate isomerase/epimerase
MTDPSPYRFGVSQFTTNPWSFQEDIEGYARLGVDVIEVCEVKLDADRAADQLALVGQTGLAIGSVQPEVRTLFPSRTQPEPKEPGERISRLRHTIERFGRFADGVPFVCNTGPPLNGNIQEILEVAAREYRALAEFAAEHGAPLLLGHLLGRRGVPLAASERS